MPWVDDVWGLDLLHYVNDFFLISTRFFEPSSSSVSVTKGTTAVSVNEKPAAAGGTGAAGGAGKGKLLLRADEWTKEKKNEKQNDGDKEKAKSIISKFVTDETNKTSSLQSQHGGVRASVKWVLFHYFSYFL